MEIKRNSNFELLRIITMLCVVATHTCAFTFETPGFLGKFYTYYYTFGLAGLNSFFMMSGYFMGNRPAVSKKKIISMFVQIIYCQIISLIVQNLWSLRFPRHNHNADIRNCRSFLHCSNHKCCLLVHYSLYAASGTYPCNQSVPSKAEFKRVYHSSADRRIDLVRLFVRFSLPLHSSAESRFLLYFGSFLQVLCKRKEFKTSFMQHRFIRCLLRNLGKSFLSIP